MVTKKPVGGSIGPIFLTKLNRDHFQIHIADFMVTFENTFLERSGLIIADAVIIGIS